MMCAAKSRYNGCREVGSERITRFLAFFFMTFARHFEFGVPFIAKAREQFYTFGHQRFRKYSLLSVDNWKNPPEFRSQILWIAEGDAPGE